MRTFYLSQDGVPGRHTLAAFLVERILDVAVISLIAAAILGFNSDHNWLLATALGIVALLVILIGHGHIARPAFWLAARTTRWGGFLLDSIARSIAPAKSLLEPKPLFAGLALGAVAWVAEGIGLAMLLGLDCGHCPGMHSAIAIYSIAVLTGALTFIPGGLGGTEVTMVLLLTQAEVPTQAAVVATILCRITTCGLPCSFGWLAVSHLPWPRQSGENRP